MKRIITILTLWLAAVAAAVASIAERITVAERNWKARAQAGNNSTELILIILGIIVVAGILITAVTAYLRSKVSGLQ